MKKIVATLLLLVMIAGTETACADKLNLIPGTNTACHIKDFTDKFDFYTRHYNSPFVWQKYSWQELVFLVFYAKSEDDTRMVRVYTRNQQVSYVEFEGTLTAPLDDLTIDSEIGRWFGVPLMSICLALSIGETSYDRSVSFETASQIGTELKALMNDVLNRMSSEENLKNGTVVLGNILGYCTGVEMSGSTDGSEATIHMKIIATSPDGELIIVQ